MSPGVAAVLARVETIAAVVRTNAAESERAGCLVPEVIDAIRGADLVHVLAPLDRGGSGLTLPESLEVYEAVARLDASTGWTLAILANSAVFARRLPARTQTAIEEGSNDLIAGSLNPMTARAEEVEGGFVLNGRASYVSGGPFAAWLMATALVVRDGQPVPTDYGIHIRTAIMPMDRAVVQDTWHVTGMRATSSNDCTFEDVFVPTAWTFEPMRPLAPSPDPIARIPLWGQLGSSLAACAVGAAGNMVDQFIALAIEKVPVGSGAKLAERPSAQSALGEAHGLTQAAHDVLVDSMQRTWAHACADHRIDNAILARQRTAAVTSVQLACRATDLLQDAAGMTAVASDSVLGRCWRDVHTISQHVIIARPRYEIAGRVLLGLDPGSPII